MGKSLLNLCTCAASIHIAILLLCCASFAPAAAKVYERCELAQLLKNRFNMPLTDVATWVCIAQHTSNYNSAAYGGGSGPAGGSHGIFQISDVYWCSPPGKGLGCNINCARLRDDDLTDDMACARQIYAEHQRISGDGYTAWQAYQPYCQQNAQSYIDGCFSNNVAYNQPKAPSPQYNSIAASYTPSKQRTSKIYNRCELAQELYYKHQMQMEQIPTWVCIAQHESNFDTSAVGRLNADGSADHGLFQISDLYWCSHDRRGGKACNLPCSKLLDTDISDDVHCVKRIFNEHTRISGDGFTAWTVYNRDCRNQRYEHVAACFAKPSVQSGKPHAHPNAVTASKSPHYKQPQWGHRSANPFRQPAGNKYASHPNAISAAASKPSYTYTPLNSFSSNPFLQHKGTAQHGVSHTQRVVAALKGKVYKRCELAQEMYFKHKFPMQDIATWVCIAEHESRYDTSAVGRLNADGSEDHGLFQISDLYWCTHDEWGGKGCSISCDKLLDSDITDDVKCIRTIHEEHTRISGDGFTAWTVYNPHCRSQTMSKITDCFDEEVLRKEIPTAPQNSLIKPTTGGSKVGTGKIYNRCELAQELYHKHKMPMQQIPTWVCIAKYESSLNTAAVGRLNTDGSEDHGLFQISDLYWCTHDGWGGKGCGISCDKLLDSDITDDVKCIKTIHEEHTRISGDGFTAWTVYNPHCRSQSMSKIADCFDEEVLRKETLTVPQNSLIKPTTGGSKVGTGKIYNRCELAQELYHKHKMPMQQIPTWVCIAKYESSLNTAAVGRLNTDGSEDHGLFQISDLYWCTHDSWGGKGCGISCDKLLDSDITDDVKCIRTIHEEHTRISGDGFTAWTVYNPHCRSQTVSKITDCFDEEVLRKEISTSPQNSLIKPTTGGSKVGTGKIYNRCELAQELYHKHKMPMQQIPTWVCIAKYESSFNTAAVGRLNTDGSEDHGLFQISDLYWCEHNEYGGKACNIPCSKLLDNDITDDVHCIKIIYEEHTRISGDGFTAWTVYNRNCRNQQLTEISDCFSGNEIEQADSATPVASYQKPENTFTNRATTTTRKPTKGVTVNHVYVGNPFLNKYPASNVAQNIPTKLQPTQQPAKPVSSTVISNHPYATNLFLNQILPIKTPTKIDNPQLPSKGSQGKPTEDKKLQHSPTKPPSPSETSLNEKGEYVSNPFLALLAKQPQIQQQRPLAGTNPQPIKELHERPQSNTLKPYVISDTFRTNNTTKQATQRTTTTTSRPTTNASTTYRPTFTTNSTTRSPKPTSRQSTTTWSWQQSTKTTKQPTTTTKNWRTTPTTTKKSTTTTKNWRITPTTTKQSITTTKNWRTTSKQPTTTTKNWRTTPTTTKQSTTTTKNWKTTTKQPTTTTKNWRTTPKTTKQPTTTTKILRTTTTQPITTTKNWRTTPTTTRKSTTTTKNWRTTQSTTKQPTTSTKNWRTTTMQPKTTTKNWRTTPTSTTKSITTTKNWKTTQSTTKQPTTTTKKPTTTLHNLRTTPTTKKPTTTRNWSTKTTPSPYTTKPTTTWQWFDNRTTTTKRPEVKSTSPWNWQHFKNNNNNNITTTTRRTTTIKTTIKPINTALPLKTTKQPKATSTTHRPTNTTTHYLPQKTATTPHSDPFDHPFFAKYKAEFDNFKIFGTTQKPNISASFGSSSYYEKFRNETEKNAKTIYSYSFGKNHTQTTTTTKRPTAKTTPTTANPKRSVFDFYLKKNNN